MCTSSHKILKLTKNNKKASTETNKKRQIDKRATRTAKLNKTIDNKAQTNLKHEARTTTN